MNPNLWHKGPAHFIIVNTVDPPLGSKHLLSSQDDVFVDQHHAHDYHQKHHDDHNGRHHTSVAMATLWGKKLYRYIYIEIKTQCIDLSIILMNIA